MEEQGEVVTKEGFVKVTVTVSKHEKTTGSLEIHQQGAVVMKDIFVELMVAVLKDVESTEMQLAMAGAREIVRSIIFASPVEFANIRQFQFLRHARILTIQHKSYYGPQTTHQITI